MGLVGGRGRVSPVSYILPASEIPENHFGAGVMFILMSRKTDTAEEMGDSLRINLEAGNARKSTVAAACDVFDCNKTQAVLSACRFAAKMAGNNSVRPRDGNLADLMEVAESEGSVTAEQAAELLTTDEIPVSASLDWGIEAGGE